MKRTKFVFYSVILLIMLLICFLVGFVVTEPVNDKLTLNNGTLNSRELLNKSFTSRYTPKTSFDDMKVSSVQGVTFDILSSKNIKDINVILKAQRYYIPVNYIAKKLGYSVVNEDDHIKLVNAADNILIYENNYENGLTNGSLRGNLITQDNEFYISISDIEKVFNLIAIFKFDENRISFYNSNNTSVESSIEAAEYSKASIIRLEDFTAGSSYISDKNQTKVKCVADLLYSKGIKYHVSWIPKYKNPSENIDNDLLEVNSISNVGFVNLLDYLINHNALIGLHGYTHQSGDTTTGLGIEIADSVNNSNSLESELIEKSIDTSTALNIKYYYFETPHYKGNKEEKKVLEKYFQYIYEPFDSNNNTNLYKNGNHLYIPTPLSYVVDKDISKIVDGIASPNTDTLTSFFYHPYIEYEFINFNTNNGTFNVNYDTNSPLQQIIKSLEEYKCKTIHIDQLNKNTIL